jgi:hypothetical protein
MFVAYWNGYEVGRLRTASEIQRTAADLCLTESITITLNFRAIVLFFKCFKISNLARN